MIDLEDAQAIVLRACPPQEAVALDHREALGYVLAESVIATEDVPPFDNSAVDGYAVRAVDTADAPVELAVIGELAAGATPFGGVVGAGQTIRIMTGAPMPAGADAAAMVEDSERLDGNRVRLTRVGVARERACVEPATTCVSATSCSRPARS